MLHSTVKRAADRTAASDAINTSTGTASHWRDRHFAAALSPSLLKHLLRWRGCSRMTVSPRRQLLRAAALLLHVCAAAAAAGGGGPGGAVGAGGPAGERRS